MLCNEDLLQNVFSVPSTIIISPPPSLLSLIFLLSCYIKIDGLEVFFMQLLK